MNYRTIGLAGMLAAAMIAVPMCVTQRRQEPAAPRVVPRSSEPRFDSRGTPPIGTEDPAHGAATFAPAGAEQSSTVPPVVVPSDDAPAGALPWDIMGMDESYSLTVDGLAAYTIEEFSQEGFVALTVEKASLLIGEDLSTYPELFIDFLGGLPTREDCERGFESHAVKEALTTLIVLDTQIVSVRVAQIERLAPSNRADDAVAALVRQRDAAELDLARALEGATSYKGWPLLTRVFRAWSRRGK